jgi:hypothetical protein
VDATHLLLVDHLEGVTERAAALLLHLDDKEAVASPEHEIELVPADADVRVHEPVSAKPVVEECAALAAIHAASTAP